MWVVEFIIKVGWLRQCIFIRNIKEWLIFCEILFLALVSSQSCPHGRNNNSPMFYTNVTLEINQNMIPIYQTSNFPSEVRSYIENGFAATINYLYQNHHWKWDPKKIFRKFIRKYFDQNRNWNLQLNLEKLLQIFAQNVSKCSKLIKKLNFLRGAFRPVEAYLFEAEGAWSAYRDTVLAFCVNFKNDYSTHCIDDRVRQAMRGEQDMSVGGRRACFDACGHTVRTGTTWFHYLIL